jgi:hypothetical protein
MRSWINHRQWGAALTTDQPPPARHHANRRLVPVDRFEAILRIVACLGFFWLVLPVSRLVEERWIAITWPRVEATVTSVASAGERGKGGYPFHVMLEATLPDGRRIAPSAPVTLHSAMLDPTTLQIYGDPRQRPPQPGERIPAYADARGPGVLVPEESLMRLGLPIMLLAFMGAFIGPAIWRLRNPP